MTVNTTVRRLGPDDAAGFRALRLRGLREHPNAFLSSPEEDAAVPLEEVARRLGVPEAEAFVLGAFGGGTLVGVVGCGRDRHEKARHNAVIWGMYVLPDARRAGIGRALLASAIERARELGIERLHLGVDVDNHDARQLYADLGFQTWGIQVDAFRVDSRPITEEHMVLSLLAERP